MNDHITQTVYISVGVFVLLLALVLYAVKRLAKTLTDPLIALRNDVQKISGGNLNYRAQVRANNEIGDLAEEFNNMAQSLGEYMDNVTRVVKEHERIDAELDLAKKIQLGMLPAKFFPDRREFDIYATMIVAKEVGGDFYDFFFVDKERLALVMADVSGKGVPAALFMVVAQTMIRNKVKAGGTPAAILHSVNNDPCAKNDHNLFVTVWLGIFVDNAPPTATAVGGFD